MSWKESNSCVTASCNTVFQRIAAAYLIFSGLNKVNIKKKRWDAKNTYKCPPASLCNAKDWECTQRRVTQGNGYAYMVGEPGFCSQSCRHPPGRLSAAHPLTPQPPHLFQPSAEQSPAACCPAVALPSAQGTVRLVAERSEQTVPRSITLPPMQGRASSVPDTENSTKVNWYNTSTTLK